MRPHPTEPRNHGTKKKGNSHECPDCGALGCPHYAAYQDYMREASDAETLDGDTITDEQIRSLETEHADWTVIDLVTAALAPAVTVQMLHKATKGEIPALVRAYKKRAKARARCAEILNARGDK